MSRDRRMADAGNLPSLRQPCAGEPASSPVGRGMPRGDVAARVRDGRTELVEEVIAVAERAEHADGREELHVAFAHALDQHGDAAPLELLDDLRQHVRAGRVDELQLRHPQDHHGDAVAAT